MTFREKLAKEHPEYVNEKETGGCKGCPCTYGYEKTYAECPEGGDCDKCWDREIPKTYEEGLQDAWELLDRLEHEIVKSVCCEIFGYTEIGDILDHFTPQEALAKLKAYEEEQEIKVGDVVYFKITDNVGIVTKVYVDDMAYICFEDGSSGLHKMEGAIKTGKHIDIESILGQIRGE